MQNAPVKTWSGQGFYSCTFSATRCGNLVTATISGRCNGQMANTSTSQEAFAYGYRPRANTDAVLRTSSGAALVGVARFYTNGTVFWWIPASVPNGTELTCSCAYFTNNTYPQ